MRILLVAQYPRLFNPGNFQWPNDTARALRRLGHAVEIFGYRESLAASPSLARRVQGLPAAAAGLRRYQQRQRDGRDQALVARAARRRPDLVLLLNGERFSREVLARAKRASGGMLATWWADDPCRFPSVMESLDVFDCVCVFDRSYLPRLRAGGAASAHFLPCACDDAVYRPMALTPGEQRRYGCDIAFVAWYYPERGAVVGALARSFDVGVWGGQWRSAEAQQAVQRLSAVRGAAVSDRTAATIYNAAKIGLNIHAVHSVLGGLNTRAFELLASGCFQLTDGVGGIEQLLTPGEEVACYASPEEACRLAARYLADPAERLRIAARGRERVLDEHTYYHRMQTLLALLGRAP